MQEEVAALTGQDALAGYDVDLSDEGKIISEYLARIEHAS